jgi:PAS domain S-box-containing protein
MENKNIKILIIDDIQDNITTLKALIEEAFPNASTFQALSGMKGIAVAKKEDPDVILLDIVMPGMDGFEVCSKLKEEKELREIPVVFVTALKGDKEDQIKALECGAEAFLAKPVDVYELTAQIKSMVKIRIANKQKLDENIRLAELVEKKTKELKIEIETRKESENKFRLVFEKSPVAKTITYLSGEIYPNESFCKTIGYSKEELMGGKWQDITHPDDLEISKRVVDNLISGEKDTTFFQKRYIKKDGSILWAQVHTTINRDMDGNPLYFITVIIDITDRLLAEKELFESQQNFKLMFEDAPLAYQSLNEEGNFITVNNAWLEMLGYDREDVIGKWFGDFIDPSLKEHFLTNFPKFKNEVATCTLFNMPKKNGETLSIRFNGRIGHNDDGSFRKTHCILQDITEQQKTTEKLYRSEKRNREWIENSPVCTKILDLDFNLQFMSSAGVTELGIKDITKYYNHPYPFDFYPESFKSVMIDNLELSKSTGEIITQEAPVFDLNGKEIWYQSTIVPIKNERNELDYIMVVSLDTTKHKEAEKLLRKQEEEQRLILQEMQIGIIVHNKDTSILFCNEQAEEIFEMSKDDMHDIKSTDKTWDFVDENGDKLNVDEYPISLVLREGKSIADYLMGIKAHNTHQVKWLNVNGTIVFDEEGSSIERVVISFLDITERKQNTEKLLSSELKQKAMISNISDVIGILGADGTIKYKSDNIEKYFGWKPEDLIGKDALVTVHPDDLEEIRSEYEDLISNPNITKDLEFRYLCKDGNYKYVLLSAMNIIDNTSVNGILINYKDITEKKRSEKNYETMIRTTRDGFWLVDISSNFIDVNDSYCKMIGYTKDELLQMNIADIEYYEDIEDIKNRIKTIKDVGYVVFETKHAHKNGSLVDVEVSTTYLEITNNFLVFVRDVSERKRSEKEKVLLEGQLRNQQKLESIGTLASGVAHEINNPINGIMNYAQLIMDEVKEESDEREYAEEIIKESLRVSEIVKNLLEFSRQNTESNSTAKIEDIIDRTLSLIRTVVKHDQIDIEINVEKDLPDIECRSQQIQQVLMNLFTNARDALNNKYEGYHEDKKIIVESNKIRKDEKDWIRITVEDHGFGIPKLVQEKIFDPFFTTKNRSEGTGLGLSISFGIIQEHGGELSFETEEGEYTRFYIDLPIKMKIL